MDQKKYYEGLADDEYAKKKAEDILARRAEFARNRPTKYQTDRIIEDGATGLGESVLTVKGGPDKIDTKAVQKVISGDDFTKQLAKKRALNKLMKKGLAGGAKMLGAITGPIGGIISAMATGDVNAAVPLGFEVEGVGPEKGSPASILENPEASPEEREAAYKQMYKRNALSKLRR